MSTELAAALGVTDQTVRNWRDAGMRPCGRRPDALGRARDVWRLGEARAWKVRNRPVGQDGGRRPGAGRKRKQRTAHSTQHTAEKALPGQKSLEDVAKEKTEEQKRLDQARQNYRGNMASAAEVQLLLSRSEEAGGLSLVDAKIRAEQIAADRADLELKERRGELVEAEEIEERWSSFLREIAAKLSAWPGRAAAALAEALKLGPEQVGVARRALTVETERLAREVVEGVEEPAAVAAAA